MNAVAPGPTETEALAAAGLPDTVIDEIKRAEADRIPSAGAANPTRSPAGSADSPIPVRAGSLARS